MKSSRVILLSLTIWASASWLAPSQSASFFTDKYDAQIQRASAQYLPGLPWQLGKAQLFQESHLRPEVCSGVGACGIAQFMPGTWADVAKALKFGTADRFLADPAITAWAYYMAQTRRRWVTTDFDKHRLALAGYNAGNGNIAKASRACDNSLVWDRVAECLPTVTGRFSAETIGYVKSIWKWWKAMMV